jgi:hypothetical protein
VLAVNGGRFKKQVHHRFVVYLENFGFGPVVFGTAHGRAFICFKSSKFNRSKKQKKSRCGKDSQSGIYN